MYKIIIQEINTEIAELELGKDYKYSEIVNGITNSIVKEKWIYPWKNVLVYAWHAKAKMADPASCFKNSRSRILTKLTRLDKDVCKSLSL